MRQLKHIIMWIENWIEHTTDAWVSNTVLAITCTQWNRDIGGISACV